jgi:tripartite ATP-independent transporter DctM subunit
MPPADQILGGLMFVGMIAFLFFGFPVAFSLTFTGFFFGGLAIAFGFLRPDFLQILPLRIWGTMTNFTLLAVPLFVFMGVALEKSGLAEELLETMGLLFGKLRGGLAISVVVVGAILAASTGIVGASVITMGLISLPTMLRRGYNKELICGTICASGTLGQIIPPSVILILLGDIMGVPVGDLYIGAVVPGLVLVALYIIYLVILSHFRPDLAPAVPAEELAAFRADALKRVTIALIPAFLLIVGVLGSIFLGVASATEAASVGAAGGLLLTIIKGRFSMPMLRGVMQTSLRITSLGFIILVGANCFGLVFRGLNGDHLIQDFLKSLPFGAYGVLALVMGVIFILGFFIDFFEICFIHVPILTPVLVTHFGFDPVWVGVVLAVNLQTSFLTPPFGFALFFLRGVVSPSVITTPTIYRGVIPFVFLQLIGLSITIAFPQLSLGTIRFFRSLWFW